MRSMYDEAISKRVTALDSLPCVWLVSIVISVQVSIRESPGSVNHHYQG